MLASCSLYHYEEAKEVYCITLQPHSGQGLKQNRFNSFILVALGTLFFLLLLLINKYNAFHSLLKHWISDCFSCTTAQSSDMRKLAYPVSRCLREYPGCRMTTYGFVVRGSVVAFSSFRTKPWPGCESLEMRSVTLVICKNDVRWMKCS